MSLKALPGLGFLLPSYLNVAGPRLESGFTIQNASTLDASGERAAFSGYMFWQGYAASKTVSSAGGKIHFRTGSAVTFANASTVFDVGIQDLSATTAPAQPDDTFDVKDSVTAADGTLSSSSDAVFVSIPMSTGSKTIATGDKIAVVFDMVTRAGADSVILAEVATSASSMSPAISVELTGTWSIGTPGCGICIIEADDGTLGTLMGTMPVSLNTARSYSDATNPDEEAFGFTLDREYQVAGYVITMQETAADADYSINLYSDPTGTPALVSGSTITGEGAHAGGAVRSPAHFMLPAAITLQPNISYGLAIKATGASQITTTYSTLRSANDRPLFGLENCGRMTRNGGSGAFSALTTTEFPNFGLIIKSTFDEWGSASAQFHTGGLH